jgi:cobalt/nickel transport system permease protein/cobalt/nickel transport protein
MQKEIRKYLLFLLALAFLCPIGIILPKMFNSGDAWGEWSTETVKKQTGIEPAKMKSAEGLYHAPLSDYSLKNSNGSMKFELISYTISAIAGIAIIFLITITFQRILKNKNNDTSIS